MHLFRRKRQSIILGATYTVYSCGEYLIEKNGPRFVLPWSCPCGTWFKWALFVKASRITAAIHSLTCSQWGSYQINTLSRKEMNEIKTKQSKATTTTTKMSQVRIVFYDQEILIEKKKKMYQSFLFFSCFTSVQTVTLMIAATGFSTTNCFS